MKKVGQFFFTFIPLLLAMGIQYLAMFFCMGVSALIENTWYTASGTAGILDIFYDLWDLWLTSDFNTCLMIVYSLLTIALFGLWYYSRYDGNYRPNPRSVFHPLTFVGIVMLVPGLQYLCTYIISFTASLFPRWLETYEDLLETAGMDDTITFGLFVYSIILAPVSEELIFRGVTMRQAKKYLPFWTAHLFQAFLFGGYPMIMLLGVFACGVGLIVGDICEKSGSIYNSILLHMLFNFWGTILSGFFYIGDSVLSVLFWFLFGIAMTIGGAAVFAAGTRKCSQASERSAWDAS